MCALMMRRKVVMLASLCILGAIAVNAGMNAMAQDWRKASRASIGMAPDPQTTREAVIQVYAARAARWRGTFGVHSWISVKPTNAEEYTVYEVVGWRAYRGGSALAISNRIPDGRWFGNAPDLLAEARGNGVDNMIMRLDDAAQRYPYANDYRIWPGPNSNTFVAHVLRAVPELKTDLPPTAIGKDFIPGPGLFAEAPSGTGYQVSLFGLLGVLIGIEEGLEINLLGLTFGIDPASLAIKLPLIGRVGFTEDKAIADDAVAAVSKKG
jgi:hypothetical protein